MNVAYIRVSTVEQNESRQIEALEKQNIEKWFTDKVSGKDTNRPQLQVMLDYVREGDTIYVHDFSRLARSTKDLLSINEKIKAKGAHIVSNKENIDSSTPTGKLMLTMIGAIAEFERQNMLERQAEGIAIAKREGKFKGGQVKKIDNKTWEQYYNQYIRRELTKIDFSKALKISRPTLDKLIREKRGEAGKLLKY
ncbi:MAG: recombinase family protein [Suipraeoptans sp.]